jgi:membrane associated rhomboid family serine protease
MMLPCPENPQSWSTRPITWMLVILNVFIFLLFFADAPQSKEHALLKGANLQTAGRVFLRMLPDQPLEVQQRVPGWIFRVSSGNKDDLEMVGFYAVRQSFFAEQIARVKGIGDEVAVEKLRRDMTSFQESLPGERLHRFGLSPQRERSFAWITYQFSHVGFLHLASNMVFLIVLGWAIEGMFGGLTLLMLYVMGGIAGGFLFLGMFPHSFIPMLGASGSVSALIAFYAFAESRRCIRYYYILFPSPGLHGFIYLPALLMVPLYLLADWTGLLAAPEGLMTGVAYSAHIGGAIFGASAALTARALMLSQST